MNVSSASASTLVQNFIMSRMWMIENIVNRHVSNVLQGH